MKKDDERKPKNNPLSTANNNNNNSYVMQRFADETQMEPKKLRAKKIPKM